MATVFVTLETLGPYPTAINPGKLMSVPPARAFIKRCCGSCGNKNSYVEWFQDFPP